MRRLIWASICFGAASLFAVEVPSGTELRIRLTSAIASDTAKPKQPVKAVLIMPLVVDGEIVVPAGSELNGVVKSVEPVTDPHTSASLLLDFNEIHIPAGEKQKLAAKVAEIDNARESVDQTGKIIGIIGSETFASRIDQGIGKLAQKYAGLAGVLQATKDVVGVKEANPDIVYKPGAELTLKLTRALDIKKPSIGNAAKLQPFSSEADVIDMVAAQPFRTFAANPPRPSDIANLLFVGTQDRLEKAFAAAGWSTAAALNGQSKLETARAIIEERGYKEAPVSTLLLDGNPPDLVFQKQNNTFAQRHHLRIWRRPGDLDGQPIWVCAATHDIGIDFSDRDRTFIHKIDPDIDNERAKVVGDLLFTQMVKSLELVDRPQVPKQAQNATGDNLETDGKMAVLLF
ncbi:MAG: LssY C-terminal domain-containing protein [Acidobacteriota bacterium]|nr:LssY C-terminal domain-containing protein [Acidobacteriota bacterium]